MSAFFYILIHDRLLPKVRELPRALRDNVQKCCERLQFGYWGSGTRVKLLRGVRKLVYEARVSHGWRLLFTAARMPGTKPPYAPEHYLLVWDVVTHDELNHVRRLNLQPETGFLDFVELAAAEIETPPPSPEIPVPETPAEAPDDVLPALLTEPPGNLIAQDELTSSIRWFELAPDIVTDPNEWQALLDDTAIKDLELKLSTEQAYPLHAPGPVLLRGTAGSGKTTVSVYRLAKACLEQPHSRILYVTYSEPLLASVRQLFDDLFRARRQPLPTTRPEFLIFPELCLRLAGSKTGRDHGILRYPLFAQWYNTFYRTADAALAWEEIRGIVKGACRDLDQEHLSQREYEELGRKRAPLFVAERPRLYKVFLKYRDWCRQEGRSDDLDLTRQAFRALGANASAPRYDHVLCDEGQDLTELEVALLLKLCRSLTGLFFAADPQQIVNPSGFRWAEIRSLLREANPNLTAPQPFTLTRNYRSVQSIVALANALLRIQRERTGRSDDDDFQETLLQGATPVLVSGAESEVLEHLRGFGPRCAVITATDAEAERVAKLVQSDRVFSVPGAKGLEFDACVLWNLFSGDVEVWSAVLREQVGSLKEDPVARRALHHVYVGVTRARRYLGVFEANPAAAALWQAPRLRAQIEADRPEALARFMVFAASPAEWEKEGEYFQGRARFRQAAECFRRAGNQPREQESMALFYEAIEDFAAAAPAFAAAKQWLKAARCHERVGRLAEAARYYGEAGAWAEAGRAFELLKDYEHGLEAYRQAHDQTGEQRCQLALFVARHDWLNAAKLARKLGLLETTADYLTRAGRRQEADQLRVEAALAAGDHQRAGQLLEQQGLLERAAKEYRLAGPRAAPAALRCTAQAAERRKDWTAAAKAWTELGETARAADCALKAAAAAGDWRRIAAIYDSRNDTVALTECLREHQDDQRAQRWLAAIEDEREGYYGTAAVAYEELGDYARAERLAQRAIELADNPRQYQRVGISSGEAWEQRWAAMGPVGRGEIRRLWKAGNLKGALKVRLTRGFGLDEQTARLLREVAVAAQDWKRAAKESECLEEWDEAAKYQALAGDPRALARLRALAAEQRQDYATAGEQWELAKRPTFAAKNRALAAEQRGDFAAAAEYYTRARMTAQARRVRALIPQVAVPDPPDPPVAAPPPATPPPTAQPNLF